MGPRHRRSYLSFGIAEQESARVCTQNLTQIRCVETRQALTKPGSQKCPINLGYYYFCAQGAWRKNSQTDLSCVTLSDC